jgi:hypothetical protein
MIWLWIAFIASNIAWFLIYREQAEMTEAYKDMHWNALNKYYRLLYTSKE